MSGVLASIARRVPPRVVQAVGRQRHDRGPFRIIYALTRSALSGDVVVARGPAAGLTFNAGGGRPGYALGTWEADAQEAFAGLINEGDVVYDIGAAVGFFTLIAGRGVGASGKVIAFEPLPASLELLRHNIDVNNFTHVSVQELALSDAPGQETLIEGGEVDQAVLASMPRAAIQQGVETKVEVSTIDLLVEAGTIPPPNLLKMDIEGAEIEALRGATDTFAKHRPVLFVEVHDRWDEFAEIMRDFNYEWTALESEQATESATPSHAVARPKAS